MQGNRYHQRGGSPIVTLLIIALIGYVIFVSIQYAPQWMESRAVQSILDDVNQAHTSFPINDAVEARGKVIKLLQVNEMNDMTNKFKVSNSNGRIVISFSYERELNLLFEKRVIHYEQSTYL